MTVQDDENGICKLLVPKNNLINNKDNEKILIIFLLYDDCFI